MDALAEEGGVDCELIGARPALHKRQVLLRDAPPLHEHAEMPGGSLRLRDEDETAGLAVEPVDDGNLAAVCEFERKQVAEQMPHGGGIRGLAGMDLKERRLVHDDPLGGLRDDSEAARKQSGLRGSVGPGHSAE